MGILRSRKSRVSSISKIEYTKTLKKSKKSEKFGVFSNLGYTTYMRTIKNTFLACVASLLTFQHTFADDSAGIYGVGNGITKDDLRTGNLSMDSIPMLIASSIEYLLAIAGTISVVALIYHAVRMQLASGITWDSSWVTQAQKWMKWAALGFILAMSSWFLMTKLVALLASTTS